MKAKDWFLNELEEVKNDVEFQTYDANLRFIEELIKISQKENIEHINKFLSEKLNCSAAYVSKILKGNPNLTIKKMVELGLAFNYKIEIKLVRRPTTPEGGHASNVQRPRERKVRRPTTRLGRGQGSKTGRKEKSKV